MNQSKLTPPRLLLLVASCTVLVVGACSNKDQAAATTNLASASATNPPPTSTVTTAASTTTSTTNAPTTTAPTTTAASTTVLEVATTQLAATTVPPVELEHPPVPKIESGEIDWASRGGEPDWVQLVYELNIALDQLKINPNMEDLTNVCLAGSPCELEFGPTTQQMIDDGWHVTNYPPNKVVSAEVGGTIFVNGVPSIEVNAEIEVPDYEAAGSKILDATGDAIFYIVAEPPGTILKQYMLLSEDENGEWRAWQLLTGDEVPGA